MLKLKELRQQMGLTQGKLAEKLGLARSTIAMYETNGSEPDLETLYKIATFFNVSIDYLMGREEYENFSTNESENYIPQKENTVRIIGRGGVVKEYKVTEEQQKAFELLLASLPKDGIDPDVDF